MPTVNALRRRPAAWCGPAPDPCDDWDRAKRRALNATTRRDELMLAQSWPSIGRRRGPTRSIEAECMTGPGSWPKVGPPRRGQPVAAVVEVLWAGSYQVLFLDRGA